MRERLIKPKRQQSVDIPAALADFLAYVHQLIVDGDEAAIHESDDMLQAECAYGGLITEGGTEYGFTYFPGEDVRSTWEILLDTADIAGIAIGAHKELTLWACQSPNCGNKFSDPEEACFEYDYTG